METKDFKSLIYEHRQAQKELEEKKRGLERYKEWLERSDKSYQQNLEKALI